MSTHTMPTGLFGPGGIVAFECPGSASQKSAGLYWNFGSRCTPVTFHSPIGSGSCSLPVVTGAYIRTLPAPSPTIKSDVLFFTVIVVAAGLSALGSASDCRPRGGPTG